MVNMMLLSVGPHTVAGSRIDALYALKGVDSARAASCGTSVASCFTGRCHRERWPYLASTGVSGLPASQGGYVFRGVDVPVVDRAARGARPLADAERLRTVLDPARAAHLRRRLEPACPPELPAVKLRLVLQLAHERGPSRVVDRLSQPRAGESFHREVFHRDRLVFADHLGGGLVVEVPPRVGDVSVRAGRLDPRFLPVAAAFLLAAQVFLRSLE